MIVRENKFECVIATSVVVDFPLSAIYVCKLLRKEGFWSFFLPPPLPLFLSRHTETHNNEAKRELFWSVIGSFSLQNVREVSAKSLRFFKRLLRIFLFFFFSLERGVKNLLKDLRMVE